MVTYLRGDIDAYVQYVELIGISKTTWRSLRDSRKDEIYKLRFIKRWHGNQIFLDKPYKIREIDSKLASQLN